MSPESVEIVLRIHHVRGGKVTRLVLYADRERGLVELGLSEQNAHADC